MAWAEDYHASVFIRGPNNTTVLIHDETRPPPRLWKFPGGKMEPNEDPDEYRVRIYVASVLLNEEVMKKLESY